MKKIIPSIAFTLIAFTALPAMSAEQTVKLSVPGMTCASCPYIVEKSISSVVGVKSVEAKMDDRSATVSFEDTLTNVEAIQQAAAGVGYPSSLFEEKGGS